MLYLTIYNKTSITTTILITIKIRLIFYLKIMLFFNAQFSILLVFGHYG